MSSWTSTAGGPTDDTGTGPGDSDSGGSSASGGQPPSDIPDEEFDGGLEGWTVFEPSASAVQVADGALHLEPAGGTVWLHDNTAVLVHRHVLGDFMMTSLVRARRSSDLASPPHTPFRLGGLMARDPAPQDGENYVFAVVGADGNDLSVEHKNTQNGFSEYEGPPWPGAEGELRICRLGSTLVLLIRENDTHPWQEVVRYYRPDMPQVLQVGPTAYANTSNADVRVSFDYVRFDAPIDLADCER